MSGNKTTLQLEFDELQFCVEYALLAGNVELQRRILPEVFLDRLDLRGTDNFQANFAFGVSLFADAKFIWPGTSAASTWSSNSGPSRPPSIRMEGKEDMNQGLPTNG